MPAMIAGGLVGGISPGVGRNKTDSNKLTDAGSLPPEPNVQNELNEYLSSTENLSQNTAGVNEPVMPRGNEGFDVKVGDVFVDADGVRHTVIKAGKNGLGLRSTSGKKSGMRYTDFESSGFRQLAPEEVRAGVGIPSIDGMFGPAYQGYEGKPVAAAAKVLKEKTGEVKKAFHDPEGEPIDFVYGQLGKEGFGLAHIAEKHGKKIVVRLPQIVNDGKKVVAPDHRVLYVLGDEVVTVRENWNNQEKRWLVTAYDKGSPSNFKGNVPSSYGRTSDVDHFSPRDDSPSGLNGIINERLSNNPDSVKNLNSISALGHEPDMPQGNETSNVKIGDVKKLVEHALGIPVREGQIRSKKIGGFISANPYNKQKNDIIRAKYRNDIATLLHEFGHVTCHIYRLTKSGNSIFCLG